MAVLLGLCANWAKSSPNWRNTTLIRIPKYLFKLVYDEQKGKAWAYLQENSDEAKASPQISYGEPVERTGVRFLPSVNEAAAKPP